MTDLGALRREYAEKLRDESGVASDALIRAFAQVPREAYLGPPPWRCYAPMLMSELTSDPADLYRNVLVAIDASRAINNGEPALHVCLISELNPQPGEQVVHIGTGTGYYTAILAELVGPEGRVTGIEVDAALAERSRANLAELAQVTVIQGNAVEVDFDPADGIYVNAGVSHPQTRWLDRLRPGGRLILPLTDARGGGVLLATRCDGSFAARFVSSVAIIPCVGGRDRAHLKRLRRALGRGDYLSVRSLRRDAHESEPECWLHAPDSCLSRRPPADVC